MDESLRAQIETYLFHLDGLIRRGRQVRDTLTDDPFNKSAIAATRVWQEDCGVTINQLSGGSKAHWLARSFSEAFLMRSTAGRAVEGAAPDEIVKRLLGVLEQAVDSLTRTDDGAIISASSQAPPPHRFDFVHNLELRPVVEQAYTDSRRALEQVGFWRKILDHPSYDAFWRDQAVDQILAAQPLKVPVMLVHSLWDQEDIYGAIAVL